MNFGNMSNFLCKVKIKATTEIKEVMAIDNFFAPREYGYCDQKTGVVYCDDEVEKIKNK